MTHGARGSGCYLAFAGGDFRKVIIASRSTFFQSLVVIGVIHFFFPTIVSNGTKGYATTIIPMLGISI